MGETYEVILAKYKKASSEYLRFNLSKLVFLLMMYTIYVVKI